MEEDSTFTIEEIQDDQLPEELKNMSNEEKEEYLQAKAKERKALMKKVQALSVPRDVYIQEKLKESGKEEDNFSQQVFQVMQQQAEERDIKIEGKAKH